MATKLLNGKTKEKERELGKFKIPEARNQDTLPPAKNISPAPVQSAAQKIKPEPKKPFIEHYDLPANYGTTSLTLITRDPNWIYAYWEVASSAVESIRKIVGDEVNRGAYVLRMFDVTAVDFNGNNANHWFDIEVGPHANNWYINIWTDNASYCADLGLRLPDGRFFTLVRSNVVTTPRKVQSWRTEQMWMEVKDSVEQKAPFVIGSIHKSEEVRKQTNRNTHSSDQRKRKIYLNDDDIRQFYSRLSPLLRDIIARRIATRGARVRKGSNPSSSTKVITLEEFRLSGLSWGQFVKKLLAGASEELVITGASESFPVGASEQSARQKNKRKFFFEIGTELIVYGRTEPDAEVRLEGKKVHLRADGTFTLRFALPDGKIPLGFTAVSNDKVEKREISTAVERQRTKYNP